MVMGGGGSAKGVSFSYFFGQRDKVAVVGAETPD